MPDDSARTRREDRADDEKTEDTGQPGKPAPEKPDYGDFGQERPSASQAGAPAGESLAQEEANLRYPECDPTAMPIAMVMFGASGGLAHSKLVPALVSLNSAGLLPKDFVVVGFGRSEMNDDEFRAGIYDELKKAHGAGAGDEAQWGRFAPRLHYMVGKYDEPESYARLARFLRKMERARGPRRRIYYMALPPSVAESALAVMRETGFVARTDPDVTSRIMMEKPFGLDLEHARRLNRLLTSMFDESQIYRVDHYLGKDAIRNVLLFRFANSIFEPLWNARFIDCVEITAAEDIGIEGRGGYYEEAGIVRDVVQNHVLQMLSLVAMEPPVSGDPSAVDDRKIDVLSGMAPILPGDYVFGQYDGYRREEGVDADSRTPTFVAVRMRVENWRWHGVPFYVRAGKALASRVTEITIRFKEIPICVITRQELCRDVMPNRLFIRIQPDEGIKLSFTVKVPGYWDKVSGAGMEFRYSQLGRPIPDAYEEVLLDAMCTVPALLSTSAVIEAEWKVVEPLLAGPGEGEARSFPNYKPGSWGPREAAELLKSDGRQWLSSM